MRLSIGGMADPDALFRELQALGAQRRLPPVERWHPKQEGAIDIRIDRDGAWRHEGAPITRPALVRLFASILRKEGDAYYLVTPTEKLRIQVDDVPLLAVDCEAARVGPAPGQGGRATQEILLCTFTDDVVLLDADHAFWIEHGPKGPRPYAHIRSGLNALVIRSLYYRLVELGEEAEGRLWLASGGARFDLGPTE